MKLRIPKVYLSIFVFIESILAQHIVRLPLDLADSASKVESVLEGLAYSEGPAIDLAGNLFFSEDPNASTSRIWKITPEGIKSVYKEPSYGSNGLEFDNQGRLHIAMHDSLLRVETDGKVTVLAAKSGTLNLARVNDLSISSMGTLFFTNLNGNTVFFRGVDGKITTRNFNSCNGVEWIEEESILYIASGGLQKCNVNNVTGEIGRCANFAGSTDGLTTDEKGNVYRASWGEGRVYAHDSTGKELGYIGIASKEVPGKYFFAGNQGNASNCHFGGPDRKTLFITGDGGCYKIKLKTAGRLRPKSAATIRMSLSPKWQSNSRRYVDQNLSLDLGLGIYFTNNQGSKVGLNGRAKLVN